MDLGEGREESETCWRCRSPSTWRANNRKQRKKKRERQVQREKEILIRSVPLPCLPVGKGNFSTVQKKFQRMQNGYRAELNYSCISVLHHAREIPFMIADHFKSRERFL